MSRRGTSWRPDPEEREFWKKNFKYWRENPEEWERIKDWLFEKARQRGMIKDEKNFKRLINMMRQYWEEGPAKVKRAGYKLLQLIREAMIEDKKQAKKDGRLRNCFFTINEALKYIQYLPDHVFGYLTYDPDNKMWCVQVEVFSM